MRLGIIAFIGLVATVWIANWLVDRYGAVPVGFGLMAPAGVYAAGVAFTLRDVVQRTLGKEVAIIAILAGAGLAWWISPKLGVASATAFLASELCDLVVFSFLESRLLLAIIASNIVGLIVDSIIFLTIAFGSLQYLQGQIVGKTWMTLLVIPVAIFVGRIDNRGFFGNGDR